MLSSIAIIVGVTFSIGKYWVEILEKYQEKQELELELTALKEKEEELQVDAKKLQNPDYIARYAREKYLYSKDGEYILQIPEE
ncbi:MAG: septum formation initiator family protein [Bacilli bacterium]|nr:septum formation initiator family protein [Bacilli bacterium]